MSDKDSPYFKIGDAFDEILISTNTKEKAFSTIKLIGKSVYNVGRFAVAEVLPAAVESNARNIDSNPNATSEMKERSEEMKEKSAEWRSRFK